MVVGAERGGLVDALAVAEHVDVAPDGAVLIQDPPRGLGPRDLERAKDVADRVAGDLEIAIAPGEVLQRRAERHHRHRPSLPPGPDTGYPLVPAVGGAPYSKCIPSGV